MRVCVCVCVYVCVSQDSMEGLRSCIAMASLKVAAVFRTSLEDNIAVATEREVRAHCETCKVTCIAAAK